MLRAVGAQPPTLTRPPLQPTRPLMRLHHGRFCPATGRGFPTLAKSRITSLWRPFHVFVIYVNVQFPRPTLRSLCCLCANRNPELRSTYSLCSIRLLPEGHLSSLCKWVLRLQIILTLYSSLVNHESNNCLLLNVINDQHNFTKVLFGLGHLRFVL